ncbi:MAG: hypothetical protein K9K88_07025 [Desulfobacterales bacterium]|nr:hypothetical protein [Desulfobacterales bacterium]
MTGFLRYLVYAIFGMILLSMADTLVAVVTSPSHLFKIVAGQENTVSGKLAGMVRPIDNPNARPFLSNRIQDPILLEKVLAYAPAHKTFSLEFIELKGRLWRARIRTDGGAHPGDYPVHVFQKAVPPEKDDPPYTVRLFESEAALRQSQASLFKRFFGFDPWWATIVLIPGAFWAFHRAFKEAGRKEKALQNQGLGPIYRLAKKKDGWELIFGLGKEHGISVGDRLQVFTGRGEPTGQEITAEAVGAEAAHGRLHLDADIKAEYLVGK